MPRVRRKLNATLLGGLLAACFLSAGCTRKLDITVALDRPVAPDPFDDVRTVRMRALVRGRVVTLGEDRWDQGPVRLPELIDPEVERLVVEGLTEEGVVVSSGASGPLDLLRSAPDESIQVFFSRVGALSRLDRSGPARRGGAAAVATRDGRILFLGGRDDAGCMVERTDLFGVPDSLTPGPLLTGGRSGAFVAQRMPSGRVLIAAGEVAPDCGAGVPSEEVAIVDPEEGTTRVGLVGPEAARPGAAIAAVSDGLAVIAGGAGDGPIPSSIVHRLSPRSLEVNVIGMLESPRANASPAVVSDQRVLLVGGRSTSSTSGALGTATVFVPERGSPLAEQIRLNAKVIEPAVLTTRAGSVLVAGGTDPRGEPSSRVDMVVVRTERDFSLGDTSTVATLPTPLVGAGLTELGDGSVLLIPSEEGEPLQWLRFLPQRIEEVPLPEGVAGGPLVGGPIADGRVVLTGPDGAFFSFNPGPAAVLGVAGAAGDLGEGDHELGLSLLRPSAWRRTPDGLVGSRTAPPGNILPTELAVLQPTRADDFEITFDVSLQGLAKAALVFGMVDDRFDFLVLGETSFVDRAPAGASRGDPACTAAETRTLASPGFHTVRIRRTGGRVALDLDADGTEELECDTPRPEAGRIALALITGTAVFDRLSFLVP